MKIKLAKTAIIAGDAKLAEQVCSQLRTTGVYLPVVESPMVRLVEYGVFEQDCVRVANAMRNLHVRTFLCLKVLPEVMEKLRKWMPSVNLIAMDEYNEIQISALCKTQRAVIKSQDLILKDVAHCMEDLFVVERHSHDLSAIIAANLAAAHGGRIAFIDSVTDEDIDFVKEQSRSWSTGSFDQRQNAKDTLIEFLQSRLPKGLLVARTIKSISFITRGLPYGILPFACPTSHFFSFPLLGLNILTGMLKSQELFRCPIAILIDPALVGRSEFTALHEAFGMAGYLLRLAFGQNATPRNASYLTAYLPSDFIFYSTHCGEEKGQRVTERFPDRHGKFHTVCYERVLSGFHSPTEKTDDLFEITVMMRFISMDSVDWSDDAQKERIKAGDLLEDYLKYSRDREVSKAKSDLIEVVDTGRVEYSDSLAMCGLNYLPLPQVVGGYHYPIVFNNSCASWRTLAIRFSSSGASVYVGTSTNILNSVGMLVVNKFVNEIIAGRTIGLALHRAQKKLLDEFGYTPYLMTGYLYTKLNNPPSKQAHQRVKSRIISAIEAMDRTPASKGKPSIMKFLKDELCGLINVKTQK